MSRFMDHEIAEKTHAVERYLLDEFTAEERAEFEAHFFECRSCADNVATSFIVADNFAPATRELAAETELRPRLVRDRATAPVAPARSAQPKKRNWLEFLGSPSGLIPSFAALILLVTVGYQNLVTLPALRQPQLLSGLVLAPAARDAAPTITVDRNRPLFNMNFAVDSARAYPAYVCTFEKQSGGTVLNLPTGPREVASFTLGILLPVSQFPDGAYTMTLHPAGDNSVVVQRYNFTVRSGGN